MPIDGQGWEFLVQRLGLHEYRGQTRTYGTYQVFLHGRSTGLHGHVCECIGPGDNSQPSTPERKRRIAQGRYPLTTQFGQSYRSVGFSSDMTVPGALRMPGVALIETGNRTAILIHPGHPTPPGDPPYSWLSSIGCLNLTDALRAEEDIEFWESRARVIAILDSLRSFAPEAFVPAVNTPIPNACAVIDGEPMNCLDADGLPPVIAANESGPRNA
jgi:hypothetical protein